MIVSFLCGTLGAPSFAAFPSLSMAVTSLFVMGAGMAALQVAINPLLRVAGGEAHFAFNSAFAQLVFGAASFLSPLVYAYLVTRLGAGTRPSGVSQSWAALRLPRFRGCRSTGCSPFATFAWRYHTAAYR